MRHPFDLAAGPLLRAGIARVAEDEHVLVLVVHHAVADGWSCGILFDELARCYAGELIDEPAIQYPDYAVWQREQADANAFGAQSRYWRAALAGIPTVLPLPTDRPRVATAGRGADLVVDLDPVPGASFGTLLAVFQSVLYRLTGQEDFLVATPVSGRTRPDTEELVGFLANTLALPARIPAGTTFAALAERAHAVGAGRARQPGAAVRGTGPRARTAVPCARAGRAGHVRRRAGRRTDHCGRSDDRAARCCPTAARCSTCP